MRRTITLPDDDGVEIGQGSVKLGESQQTDPAAVAVEYPDTLELIHHPDAIVRSAPDELEALLQQFRDARSRRRSVRAAKGLITLLSSGLLAVWLLHPPLPGGNENRAETAFPGLTPSGLVNSKNYRQTDAALRDRLALRQYVVTAIGETARDRMDTSLNPEVVMGSTGVPFLSEDFILPCQYPFDPAAVDSGLQQLRALGRSTGKTITVAIAPDKSSILTDQLGRRGGALMTCSNRVRESTEAIWGHSPATSTVLTAWNQLAAEQAAHPGKVFQRGDSHWTSQGALVWSHALIDRLIAQGEAPPALESAPVAARLPDQPADNDLYRLMGISRSETVPVWQVIRPGVKIHAKSLPSPSGHGIAEFRSTSGTEPLIKGRTLVINDSFISRAEGELAPYFSNLKVLHWADFLTDVSAGKVPHFDRIIIETVQRGWPQRAGWLQAGQPVHDALARELSTPSKTAPMPVAPTVPAAETTP